MDIREHIQLFIKQNHRYKPYSKIYKVVLAGGKPYSLNSQDAYYESEFLDSNIMHSVRKYSSNKDTAIALYKDFVKFLEKDGVDVPQIQFPEIPVSNTFERLMFIAKYLQNPEHKISALVNELWVSERTIEEDIGRLRGFNDPIQVCGKKFFIPDTERVDGKMRFQSTAHPVFLTENLTQILVMLKGLKAMSENPLYRPYAVQSGSEIWNQLSPYARNRIRVVFRELMPEDLKWYEALGEQDSSDRFHTEYACGRIHNDGPGIIMDCIKNGKSFCVEYEEEGAAHLYKDCRMEKGSYSGRPGSIIVNCSAGRKKLLFDHVIRSAYTVEELTAN